MNTNKLNKGMLDQKNSYHFVGIGGSGMSALAQILVARGMKVSGSDRYYDSGLNITLFDKLISVGISMFRQDGSGVEGKVDRVVVSTAIEEDNLDIKKAKAQNIPIIKRAELLAEIFNPAKQGIAITGTSGKTTVTAMIGFILHQLGLALTIINGGIMLNFSNDNCLGNAIIGNTELIVIEADESDGSSSLYQPAIGVITNINLDHKPLNELEGIFADFAKNTRQTLILNADCTRCMKIKDKAITFGIKNKAEIFPKELCLEKSYMIIEDTSFHLPLLGVHNVYNTLAAIAVVKALGVKLKEISEVLGKFKGIKRRLQFIGEQKGIKVIDDYAHNPDKIKATLQTLKLQFPRLIAIFQPHGFAPTRLLKEEFIQTFKEELRRQDILFMPEIYYAGGTVTKDISSNDIITPLQKEGLQAYYFAHREEILSQLIEKAKPKDGIVIMGARDDTLSEFCLNILEALKTD
ncbi:MAG: UDP-N-acetylmuramate--L-alanine ligase [bacterium]